MKRFSGANDVPERHCWTLAEIMLPSLDGQRVTPAELAARMKTERQHDAGTTLASHVGELDALAEKHADRCPYCGEPARNLIVCPLCKSPLWVREKN